MHVGPHAALTRWSFVRRFTHHIATHAFQVNFILFVHKDDPNWNIPGIPCGSEDLGGQWRQHCPFPCCATDIGSVSDSNTSQMDVDTQHNSETDSDYNPDPNDFVNFVADMYQTPGPGAGQHGPICYGWERGCTCHGCLTDTAWHDPQNGTHGITNHANGQDMLLEHKQRQDAPPSPVPKRPGM